MLIHGFDGCGMVIFGHITMETQVQCDEVVAISLEPQNEKLLGPGLNLEVGIEHETVGHFYAVSAPAPVPDFAGADLDFL